MTEQEIGQSLNALAELKMALEAARRDMQQALDDVLTEEQRHRRASICLEFGLRIDEMEDEIIRLELDVEGAVRARGASVTGTRMRAMYEKGRASWDDKGLSEAAAVHKWLEKHRRAGEPRVSIIWRESR